MYVWVPKQKYRLWHAYAILVYIWAPKLSSQFFAVSPAAKMFFQYVTSKASRDPTSPKGNSPRNSSLDHCRSPNASRAPPKTRRCWPRLHWFPAIFGKDTTWNHPVHPRCSPNDTPFTSGIGLIAFSTVRVGEDSLRRSGHLNLTVLDSWNLNDAPNKKIYPMYVERLWNSEATHAVKSWHLMPPHSQGSTRKGFL